ncbi:MAG: deoxyribose-phosphate aldolase [Afipia sp.]|nr:deoxyribose-phosphate aldolase [Afipia sp.]
MNIAKTIDHTLLKAEATDEQIRALCAEAKRYEFASACVNSCWVPLVSSLLQGSSVKTCSVVGFPLGACNTDAKVRETERAIADGAQEIDMVINIGWLKSNELSKVIDDIARVRAAATRPNILKVIIESAILTDKEIQTISEICVEQGADFVKTSTGMHTAGGAKVEHVKLVRRTIGTKALIKASGGIRTYADLAKLLESGASRIGCSAGVQIMREAPCQSVA